MQYRKKPVVIDAIQLDNNQSQIIAWIESLPEGSYEVRFCGDGTLTIPTLEGEMTAQQGDWLIRGVKGELYPCKPDIFEATYSLADSPAGRSEVYELVDAERAYQDKKWGGPEHDKTHSAWDWCVYLTKFLGGFARAVMSGDRVEARRQLVKVIALGVAALEHAPDLQP